MRVHNAHVAPVMNRQDTRARAEEAWRLRATGRTWDEIAVELGFGSRSARKNGDWEKRGRQKRGNIAEKARRPGAPPPKEAKRGGRGNRPPAVIDRMESDLLAIAARQRGEVIDAEVIE